jgi:hypothetical protein
MPAGSLVVDDAVSVVGDAQHRISVQAGPLISLFSKSDR